MWTRVMIKTRAKSVLEGNYWKAFLVAFVLMCVGGIHLSGPFDGGSGNSGSHNNNQNALNVQAPFNTTDTTTSATPTNTTENNYTLENNDSGFNFDFKPSLPLVNVDGNGIHLKGFPNFAEPSLINGVTIFLIIGVVLMALAAALIWRVFLGYPVEIGCTRFYLNMRENRHAYRDMTQYFNRDQYWNIVKAMFMRGLFNTLWYLLLIIPGVVKAYAYSMVPYILADEPELDYDTAIQRSMRMTDGYKLDMFVLDLSFIGWYLLGLLLCCVGGVFVNPYYLATKAELYTILSGKEDIQTLETN